MADRQALASNIVIFNVEESSKQSDSAKATNDIESALNILNPITKLDVNSIKVTRTEEY